MSIYWNEAEPSDSSGANLAATELRSLKSSLAVGLGQSMYWPGSGGGSAASAGQPLLGVWRAFYDTQSRVSAYADGAMLITSDTSRLFGVGSAATMFLGSASGVESATFPGVGVRWVQASGVTDQSPINFGITYNGIPVVVISTFTSAATVLVAYLTSVTPTTATPVATNLAGAQMPNSTVTFYWQSFGTVSF